MFRNLVLKFLAVSQVLEFNIIAIARQYPVSTTYNRFIQHILQCLWDFSCRQVATILAHRQTSGEYYNRLVVGPWINPRLHPFFYILQFVCPATSAFYAKTDRRQLSFLQISKRLIVQFYILTFSIQFLTNVQPFEINKIISFNIAIIKNQ